MLSRFSAAVLGFACCAIPAAAQPSDSRLAAARQMVDVLRVAEQQKVVFEQISTSIRQQAEESFRNGVAKAGGDATPFLSEFQKFMDTVTQGLFQRLSWERMQPEYVRIYAETFTEDEMKAIVDFYRSPAGKAFLDKVPAVFNKAMLVGQKMMVGFDEEFSRKLEGFLEEVKKKVRQ